MKIACWFLAAVATATASAADVLPRPDSLHVVDRNRASLVKRVVDEWGPTAAARESDRLDREPFAERLWGLRADRLLAASLAGDLDTIFGLIEETQAENSEARDPLRRDVVRKALGDPVVDLVYTPINPCRIVDTRLAGGALLANVTLTFLGYNATSFASQGGSPVSCGIPNGVAALSMNAVAVNPTSLGFIRLWASNQPEPYVSTINYEPPTIGIANGTVVPVNAADNNKFNASSPAGVHLVVDVVGYFRSPVTVGGGLRIERSNVSDTVNTINGSGANTVTPGVRGATIAGGGVPPGDSDPFHANENPNRVTDDFGFVGGGFGNQAGDNAGTVRDAIFATVAGGRNNTASAGFSAVLGGVENMATAHAATVGGGFHNRAQADYATISGGHDNLASNAWATVGGGLQNMATQTYATVAGGDRNVSSGDRSTTGGGSSNASQAFVSTIGGGWGNSAVEDFSTVSGGFDNDASGHATVVGGGSSNLSSGHHAVVSGGSFNRATGASATVGGGLANAASSSSSTVAGGAGNIASAEGATVAGGASNVAGGGHSFVAGGLNNFAATLSFSGGYRARSNSAGCFTWGDWNDEDVTCSTPNAFVVRSTGGVTFGTNVAMTTGCSIAAGGGTWSCSSSRDEKRDFELVDGVDVLDRVASLPITRWSYKSEASGARHVGPMSQDFHAAFSLGDSDRTIGLIDASGVALAAIQGLNAKLENERAETTRLKTELAELREEVTAIKQHFERTRVPQRAVRR